MTAKSVQVETTIRAGINEVWTAWTSPAAITQWNAAADTWYCPAADIDLREGGAFSYRMEAKDGSIGFDYTGTFTKVSAPSLLAFTLDDGRGVEVSLTDTAEGVRLTEVFEIEDEHTADQQRQGWQAILDRFKAHIEAAQ